MKLKMGMKTASKVEFRGKKSQTSPKVESLVGLWRGPRNLERRGNPPQASGRTRMETFRALTLDDLVHLKVFGRGLR